MVLSLCFVDDRADYSICLEIKNSNIKKYKFG